MAIPLLFLATEKLRLDARLTGIVISAFIAHSAWHWLAERYEELAKLPWPQLDPGAAALWIVLAAALAVLAWTLLGRVPVVRRGDAEAGVKPH